MSYRLAILTLAQCREGNQYWTNPSSMDKWVVKTKVENSVELIISWSLIPLEEYCPGSFIKFYIYLLNLPEQLLKGGTMVWATVVFIV